LQLSSGGKNENAVCLISIDNSMDIPQGREPQLPQFGAQTPGANYVLRHGGYAVIFNASREIAVVSAPGGLLLPGGAQEKGESAEAAAIREAIEECGLRILIDERLGVADELVFADGENQHYRKRCEFFVANVVGTATAVEPDHHLMWLSPKRALTELRHESQRWAVEQALRL
jgi:8-oxo-dGTP pyrophosphatase MutT (NUDIX family)